MIRVLIWSKSPFTQAGLESAISANPNFEIVVRPSHISESGPELANLPEDVILLDGLDGDIDEVLSSLLREHRPRPVVLLTEEVTRAEAVRLMKSGVQAILSRDSSASEIMSALDAATEGLITFSPDFIRLLLPTPAESGERDFDYPNDPLTTRETEVLALLAGGSGNK